jgi:hypothetical protein
MKTIKKPIEVAPPVTVVYNQCTPFEDFPEFRQLRVGWTNGPFVRATPTKVNGDL